MDDNLSTSTAAIDDEVVVKSKDAHQVTFTFDFNLDIAQSKVDNAPVAINNSNNSKQIPPKKPSESKYFLTYSPPNSDEAKTEMFTAKKSRWSTQHKVTLDLDSLLDMFETPIEFKVWKVFKVINQTPVVKEMNARQQPSTARNNSASPVRKRQAQLKNLEKRDQLIENHRRQRRRSAKRFHHPELVRARSPPKPHHYDSPEKTILASAGFNDAAISCETPQSGDNGKELLEVDGYKISANGQSIDGSQDVGSIKNSRRGSAENTVEPPPRSKTPPMPHHFDVPDKHNMQDNYASNQTEIEMDENGGSGVFFVPPRQPPSPHHHNSPDKTLFPAGSRPQSRSNLQSFNRPPSSSSARPKTPVAPHHHDSPEKTIRGKDDRIPRLARTGKVPEDWCQIGVMRLPLHALFWDQNDVECVINEPIEDIESTTIKVSVSGQLLTEYQRERLNPMCITVLSADFMPNKPLSYDEQRHGFKPVYCKFRFFDGPIYTNTPIAHGKRLEWNSKHVILTGTQELNELKQKLLRKKLAVEVHDRELKEGGEGELAPYGTALFSLADFVTNNDLSHMKLSAPILRPTNPAYVQSVSKRVSPSDWLSANSILKIRINVAYPLYLEDADLSTNLGKSTSSLRLDDIEDCMEEFIMDDEEYLNDLALQALKKKGCIGKFVRVIITAEDPVANEFIFELFKSINTINHSAQKVSGGITEETDNITGCHFYDTKIHVVFLEGFYKTAISKLISNGNLFGSSSKLNLIIPDLDELKSGENTYADRIWYSKEGKIWHFFIHEPIMDTMNRGSMYTQKTNRIILHAFQLLIQAIQNVSHTEVEKNQIYMHPWFIRTLSRAGYISRKTTEDLGKYLIGKKSLYSRQRMRLWSNNKEVTSEAKKSIREMRFQIDNYNKDYDEFLKAYKIREPNFIRLNKEMVCRGTSNESKSRERSYQQEVFIYSNQTMNTTELKKKQLYAELLKATLEEMVSIMLKKIADHNDQIPVTSTNLTRFHSRTPPAISIPDYIRRIVQFASIEKSCLLILLIYIDRVCDRNSTFLISSLTVHRFVIAAITVIAKSLCDSYCTNAHYARVGGISTQELNILELEFLFMIHWELCSDVETVQKYYFHLVEASDNFECITKEEEEEELRTRRLHTFDYSSYII